MKSISQYPEYDWPRELIKARKVRRVFYPYFLILKTRYSFHFTNFLVYDGKCRYVRGISRHLLNIFPSFLSIPSIQ